MHRQTAAVRLLAGDKEPVRLASTGNLALAGLLTVDGVVSVAGDRILVKDQTNATENGVYTASEGTWYRSPDANSDRLLIAGMKVAVQEGTQAGNIWNLISNRPDLDEDDVLWEFYLSTDMVTLINQTADDIIATIIALTGAADFASRAIAAGTTLPGGMTYLRTAGYLAAGDGGGALYKKVVSQPTHTGKFQSADGAWWELVYIGQPINLLQFGALGNGSTDDRAAVQSAIDVVAAAGGGVVRGVNGKTYRAIINASVTDYGLIIKSGVTLSLNSATINLECTGGIYGVRLQSNSHIEGPGTVATTVSSGSGGQAIFHAPISVGPAYGDAGTTAAPSIYSSPGNWSIRNLSVTSVRNDAQTPGGGLIVCWGGAHHGVIEDVIIPDNSTIAIGIAMDWAPIGNLNSGDIPASRILFDAGTAYTIHPHDIEVNRINMGNLSASNAATYIADGVGLFGSHGIRMSGVYNVRIDGVSMAGTKYAGIYNTAGDLGFEFAPTAVKDFRHTGIVFKNIRIHQANLGWGVRCEMLADNIFLAVSGGYVAMLPTIGTTDVLFENVFTQGGGGGTVVPGWLMSYMVGGTMRNCRARKHLVGVHIEASIDQFKLYGGIYETNWTHGIDVSSSDAAEDLLIDGAMCFSNGQGGGASDAGIVLTNAFRPVVENCIVGGDGEGFQDYGIRLSASVLDAVIINNRCNNVAPSGTAFAMAGIADYTVLAVFDGNRAGTVITNKYGGANIIPYAYTVDATQNFVKKYRASRSVLTGDTTPVSGTWRAGSIIEFTNPAAGGKSGSLCVTTGSPGTWKQFGAIDA